jgi:hypothetical protein
MTSGWHCASLMFILFNWVRGGWQNALYKMIVDQE